MGINTQGNAPSKLKMPKMGKVIDRGLYYGLQFAKNRESKRYHNILRDIALAQMDADKDNLAFAISPWCFWNAKLSLSASI